MGNIENFNDISSMEEMIEGMMGFSLFSNLGSSLISIATFVFMALGMYTIAKRRGIRNAWLAWIPFGNTWLLGCISDQYRYVAKGQEKSKRKVMLGLEIAVSALSLITVVLCVISLIQMFSMMDSNMGAMGDNVDIDSAYMAEVFVPLMGGVILCFVMLGLAIALMVLHYMALYDLFASCNPSNSTLFLVLSLLLGGIVQSICVFACRNKDMGMPPRQDQVVYTQPVWQPPQQTTWQPPQPPVEPWEHNNEQ